MRSGVCLLALCCLQSQVAQAISNGNQKQIVVPLRHDVRRSKTHAQQKVRLWGGS